MDVEAGQGSLGRVGHDDGLRTQARRASQGLFPIGEAARLPVQESSFRRAPTHSGQGSPRHLDSNT